MTQRRITDPLYIYADPMKGAAHQPPAAGIIAGAAFSAFGVGTTVLGLGAFGSFLALSAVGLALNALAPKPRFPQSERGYAVTQFGPALDQQVIYGETRIAGARVFDASTGEKNKFLHRVIAFAGHEIEGFTEVWLNDYLLTISDRPAKSKKGRFSNSFANVFVGPILDILDIVTDQGALQYQRVGAGLDAQFRPTANPLTSALSRLIKPVVREDGSIDFVGSTVPALVSGVLIRKFSSGAEETATLVEVEPEVSLPQGGAVIGAQRVNEAGELESTDRYNEKVEIYFRYGTDNQPALQELVDRVPEWTSAHRLRGIAYLYVRFEFDADVFPNGVPEITATIRGKKVFDPRTSTTAWSANPALCIRDYLTNSHYGLGATNNEIDDVLVAQAANVCDELVVGANLAGETIEEARYSLNGAFTTDVAPADHLKNMLTSMGGLLWHAQGAWRMKPAYYTAPVLDITLDDLRGGLQIQTRAARRDNFNTVRGTFRGAESDWQVTDYKPVSDPAFVTADGGFDAAIDLDLPFTSSHLTAQRIARIALQQQREQVTVSGRFGLRAFQVQVGDTVTIINPRLGWTNKEFEVVTWTFTLTEDLALEVQMTLRETSASVFTPTAGAVFEANNTGLPSPFFVPGVGINTTVTLQVLNEKVTIFLIVNVTSSSPELIDQVEVQFRETGTDDWIAVGSGELGRFEIIDLEPSQYDVRARAINTLGVRGQFEVLPAVDVSGKTTPPSDVTGLFADLNGGSVTLDWEPIIDLDLSHYTVRHAVEEVGATYANATTAAIKVPRPASEITLPVKPGTYMIRSEDKSGNRSVNYTSVVVPLAALEEFSTTLSIDNNGTFPGTLDGVTFDTDALIISDTTTAPSSGEYMLNGYIDTVLPRRFRARVNVTTVRQDEGTGLWDDIPGTFDQIPGNFDDWTGDVQFADTDVQTFISLTQDDPSGTPDWTPFQQFKAGDFFARAARFMVVLKSTSPNVTPRVSRLTAIVEHN
jgi:hypothetical protein